MITDHIIDSSFIKDNLVGIFPSSIILNHRFEIKAISSEITKMLYFTENELIGKSFFSLMPEKGDFESKLKTISEFGFLNPRKIIVMNKMGREQEIELTGFYLGLISDADDNTIVLSIKNLNEIIIYKRRLKEKVNDFNELIYRTYHDLRGPVATIKGLINISNYELDENKLRGLFDLVNESILLLDHRLTNIAQILKETDYKKYSVDFLDINRLKDECTQVLNNNTKVKPHVHINVDKEREFVYDFEILLALLKNLMRSAAHFTPLTDNPNVSIWVMAYQNLIRFHVRFEDFRIDPKYVHIINNEELNASDCFKEEAVLSFYILRSIVSKLEGELSFDSFEEGESNTIECQIFIPIEDL